MSALPSKLRIPELLRFHHRAVQLEKFKPVVSYWCNYWIIQHILQKGLHTSDDECMTYTTTLMDKLEKAKAENASNDAITDDAAGQAYIEQFALKVFQDTDSIMRLNKVNKQTIDSLKAAATFLELLEIWGPLDEEISSKIRFAKFHAVRIHKAYVAGEDPNLTNPEPDPKELVEPALDPNDPEVQALGGMALNPRQAFVEDVPDEGERLQAELASRSILNESLHPSRSSSVPIPHSPGMVPTPPEEVSNAHDFYNNAAGEGSDVSPLEPSPKDTEAGGYFPSVPGNPSITRQPKPPVLSTPPADSYTMPRGNEKFNSSPPEPGLGRLTSFPPPALPHQPSAPSPSQYASPRPQYPPSNGPHTAPAPPPLRPVSYPPPPPPPAQAPSAAPVPENFSVAEEDIAMSQKHARWAISALNFEDVPTAVKELRLALTSLGARP